MNMDDSSMQHSGNSSMNMDHSSASSSSSFCEASMTMAMYMDGLNFALTGDQPCLNLFFASWTLNSVGKFVGAMIGVFLLAVSVEGVGKFRIHFARMASIKSWKASSVRICVTLLHGFHAFLGYLVMLAVMTYSAEFLILAVAGLATGYAVFFTVQDDLNGVHVGATPCCHSTIEESQEKTLPATVAYSDACCDAADENGNAEAR